MRTTVTLDSDAEQLIRARMAAKGISFKRALNDAIRDGAPHADLMFSTVAVEMGEPMVDLTHANTVVADLEDAELIQRLRAGR